MAKPQLHVSGLLTLEGCGEQYRRRYIEGEKIPPGIAAHIGSGVDGAVNADLESKMKTGELLPLEQLKDIARDTLVERWDREDVAPDPEDLRSSRVRQYEAIDVAVSLAELHHKELAPTIEPVKVQRSWTVEVAGLPVDLVGTIDIQEANSIRDTKTKRASPKRDEAHTSLQLTTYALAAKVIDGKAPDKLYLDFLIKTQKPKLVVLETTRGPEDWQPFLERVDIATRAMAAGIFIPARPDDWRCSAKWCGYFGTCRYAMKPKSVGYEGEKKDGN